MSLLPRSDALLELIATLAKLASGLMRSFHLLTVGHVPGRQRAGRKLIEEREHGCLDSAC